MSSIYGIDILPLAERFQLERKRIGYSQAAAAREIGVSRETLRNVENAQSDFKVSLLVGASRLGMDIQFILTGVRSPNQETAEKAVANSLTVEGGVSGVAMATDGATVNITNTNQHTTKIIAQTKPGEEHINSKQRAILKELVDQFVATESLVKRKPRNHRSV